MIAIRAAVRSRRAFETVGRACISVGSPLFFPRRALFGARRSIDGPLYGLEETMGLRTKTPFRKGLAAWTLWSSDAYRRATTQRVKSLLFDIIKNFIYARDKIWDQDKRITRNEAAFYFGTR